MQARTMKEWWPGWLMFAAATASSICQAAEIAPIDISQRIDQRLRINDDSRSESDPGFLRRLTLDLAGRIPSIAEVHDYCGNTSESRRDEAIHRLMQSGIYHRNMATFWRRSWVPQADTREFAAVTDNFELWLAHRLRDGAKYDELVVEILTLDQTKIARAGTAPVGFYDANLSKPENLAASSTRAFLGMNLDCAQCHNHPFSRWTREQFWQTAAFFAPPTMDGTLQAKAPRIRIPDTELEYEPAFLTKAEIQFPQKLDSITLRRVLVDWMMQDQERLLAKNAVNRLWAHFFGEAIIEPVDDLSRGDAQSGERADLLNEIANDFVVSGYNLNVVVAGIVGSKAYRLSSSAETTTSNPAASTDSSPFYNGRTAVRGLTGEQLYDSLQTAAGLPADRADVGGGDGRGRRRDFSSQFYVEQTHNAERSISQALTLMNGSLVNELTSAKGNPLLASVLSSPFMSVDEQIDSIFIAVLGRPARDAELKMVKRTSDSFPDLAREQHMGNLFWVLVNSAEFNTNH